MGYANVAKAIAVAAVVALLLAVAVMPFIDRLDTTSPSMASNEATCSMAEAAEGFSVEISLVELSPGVLPTSTVTVGEETIVLTPGDALCWLADTGMVLATSSGIVTPASPSGMSEGDTVTISAGAITEGEQSLPFTALIVPSDSGSLGLFTESFRITSLASMHMVAGQHVGYGPASSVQPTDGSAGEFSVAYESGDGSVEVTGGTYTLDGSVTQATAFVAPIEYYTPGEETAEDSVTKAIWSAVPIILLVSLLGYIALVARRNL